MQRHLNPRTKAGLIQVVGLNVVFKVRFCWQFEINRSVAKRCQNGSIAGVCARHDVSNCQTKRQSPGEQLASARNRLHGKAMSLQHGVIQLKHCAVRDDLRSFLQAANCDGEIVAGTGDSTDVVKVKRGWHASGFRSKLDFRQEVQTLDQRASKAVTTLRNVNRCLS